MRRCLAQPSMAAVRRSLIQDSTILTNAVNSSSRGFHVSAVTLNADEASGATPKQPSTPTQEAGQQSRPRFQGPPRLGLRENAFKSGQHLIKTSESSRPPRLLQRTVKPVESTLSASKIIRPTMSPRPQFNVGKVGSARSAPAPDRPRRRTGGAGGPGPRRQARTKDQDGESAEQKRDQPGKRLSNAMVKYLLQEQRKERAEILYEPAELDKNELIGLGSGTLAGGIKQGGIELLEEHLRLAAKRVDTTPLMGSDGYVNRLLRGEIIKFKNDAEKATVLKALDERMALRAKKVSGRLGEVETMKVVFGPIPAEIRSRTEKALIKGEYELSSGEGKTREEQWKNTALMDLQKNSSYLSSDQEKFMGKIIGLIQAQPAPNAQKRPVKK